MPVPEFTSLAHPDHQLINGGRLLSAGRDADPALVADDGRLLTYGQLRQQSLVLQERFGVGKKLVLIIARNDCDTALAYVSALNAGHAVILLGPEPTDLIDRVCEQYNPNFICAHDQFEWRVVERHTDQLELHPELACLLSTSGTTGEGKFVRLSYRNLVCNALSISEYLEINAQDRFLLNLPINYSYGLSVLNSHLVTGARLLLTERSVTDPELWRFFRSNEGTGFAGVPHTYKLLETSKFDALDLPSLRTITQAGGRLPEPLARKFANWAAERGIRFYIMYGQTEASPRIAYLPPDLATKYPDCIGREIPGGVLQLVDAHGQTITETDTEGELQYSGPNVMMGYASCLSDLALGSGPNVLRTGDIAVVNSAGLFRITGRQKRFLKLYGLRISLDEIERKLETYSIKALCGGNDDFLGVMTTEDHAADQYLIELISRVSGLPQTTILLLRVAEFPLLPTGKIDYRTVGQELLKAQLARSRSVDQSGADTQIQAPLKSRIEAIFRENFPGKPIGVADSFVSLGGDSLSYVAVAVGLEDLILKLPKHWERMTIAEIETLASKSTNDVPNNDRRSRQVESAIVVRALATLLVVVNHSGFKMFEGGAALLMVIVGLNFARFQFIQLTDGRGREVLWSFLGNVMLPYWLIVMGFGAITGHVRVEDILLYHSFSMQPPTFDLPFGTWFIQVIAQIFLLLAISLKFGWVRRRATADAYKFGLMLLSIWLAARFIESVAYRALGANIGGYLTLGGWLFALGFTIAKAESRRQRMLLSCIAVIFPLVFYRHDFSRLIIVVLGTQIVIWAPMFNLPRLVASIVATFASASMFVYMLHQSLPSISFTASWPINVVQILSGIGFGIFGWWGYGKIQSAVMRYLDGLSGRGESTVWLRIRE